MIHTTARMMVVLVASTLVFASACTRATEPGFLAVPTGAGDELRLDQSIFAPDARPKNVIIVFGDGMGFGHLTAMILQSERTAAVTRMPVTGFVLTSSADRIVTDSGAGATAYATGRRTGYRMLSLTPDGSAPVRTIVEDLRARGVAVGLVTTASVNDASPAAFYAHHTNRYDHDVVAAQMVRSGVELLMGGTDKLPASTPDDAREHGYHVTNLDEDPLTAVTLPALALFTNGPNQVDNPRAMLADMTGAAIRMLSPDPDGFFLFAEHEGTDEGIHQTDIETVEKSVASLDAALAAALRFAVEDGQTLVIMTADHETGGLRVTEDETRAHPKLDIPYTKHTAEMVPILAYGPGAQHFSGIHTNEEVGRILAALVAR